MKSSTKFQIEPFSEPYQERVEALVLPIQQNEFGIQITRDDQPDLIEIAGFFQHGQGNFWVALDGDVVIGTIGLVDIGDGQVALRKMFVHKEYRGKISGVAQSLLDTAVAWCKAKRVFSITLGTTASYLAAHRFYEKNGFIETERQLLPVSFPICHVDSKFYVLKIDSGD
jgi:GNAT superfamily N-acetyltransferase